ncbi:hypothetical protein EYF80_054294 [Liparis tanakae]|uniref:Uncharacterized protein n=1 Tax=Liparis tanakae TaxID=230148 RepID=A0A4Z2F314_9TELE|nr:hypothetical protein EYF80_054294 [Liparis tanakae]
MGMKNSSLAGSRRPPRQEESRCLAADAVCGSTAEEEKPRGERTPFGGGGTNPPGRTATA